jgi:hypothetical protein
MMNIQSICVEFRLLDHTTYQTNQLVRAHIDSNPYMDHLAAA